MFSTMNLVSVTPKVCVTREVLPSRSVAAKASVCVTSLASAPKPSSPQRTVSLSAASSKGLPS